MPAGTVKIRGSSQNKGCRNPHSTDPLVVAPAFPVVFLPAEGHSG